MESLFCSIFIVFVINAFPLQGEYMWLPAATHEALQRHQHTTHCHIRVSGSAHYRDPLCLVSMTLVTKCNHNQDARNEGFSSHFFL